MPIFDSTQRSIGLQLGAAQPNSTRGFRQVAKSGPALNVVGWYYPFDWVAAGAELGFTQFGKNSRGSADALNVGVLARVNLLRNRSWTPYVLGGVGQHSTNVKIDAAFNGAPACSPVNGNCGTDQNIKGSGTSVTGGLGIEGFLFQGLSLSLESRFRENRLAGVTIESLHLLFGVHVWIARKEKRR